MRSPFPDRAGTSRDEAVVTQAEGTRRVKVMEASKHSEKRKIKLLVLVGQECERAGMLKREGQILSTFPKDSTQAFAGMIMSSLVISFLFSFSYFGFGFPGIW